MERQQQTKELAQGSGQQHGKALITSNPEKAIEIYAGLNPANQLAVFRMATPGLAAIKKDHGPAMAMAFIMVALKEIDDFYNLGEKGLNSAQIEGLATLISKDFYYLTIADLKLFSDQFRAGKLGKVFGRVDGGVILEALNKYADERINQAEAYEVERHRMARIEMEKEKPAPDDQQAWEGLEKMVAAFSDRMAAMDKVYKEKPIFLGLGDYAHHYAITPEQAADEFKSWAEAAYMKHETSLPFSEWKTFIGLPEFLRLKMEKK